MIFEENGDSDDGDDQIPEISRDAVLLLSYALCMGGIVGKLLFISANVICAMFAQHERR